MSKGSTREELLLKFLFANHDGVHVTLRFSRSTLISDVKAQLAQNWPEGVEPAASIKCIRLICMGRGMLQDSQTLDGAKVPAFETHPTPVNVSVLRRQLVQAYAEATNTRVAPKQSSHSQAQQQSHSHGHGQAQAQSTPHAPSPTPGCGCVLM